MYRAVIKPSISRIVPTCRLNDWQSSSEIPPGLSRKSRSTQPPASRRYWTSTSSYPSASTRGEATARTRSTTCRSRSDPIPRSAHDGQAVRAHRDPCRWSKTKSGPRPTLVNHQDMHNTSRYAWQALFRPLQPSPPYSSSSSARPFLVSAMIFSCRWAGTSS